MRDRWPRPRRLRIMWVRWKRAGLLILRGKRSAAGRGAPRDAERGPTDGDDRRALGRIGHAVHRRTLLRRESVAEMPAAAHQARFELKGANAEVALERSPDDSVRKVRPRAGERPGEIAPRRQHAQRLVLPAHPFEMRRRP